MKNQYKNFIIFWASQAVSQLGSSMTGFALIIWAFKQTESVMSVSLLTFFSYLPYILVSLIAGSFIDEHKKKNIMLWSDSIAFLCSASIAVLLFTGNLKIWHIYVANASGMNSLTSSMLSVITPTLAAFISSFWGLEVVVVIDMLTFGFAFCVLMFFVKIPEVIEITSDIKAKFSTGCKEGFSFLLQNKGLWFMILSNAMLNFFSRLTYENILPAMILARSDGNDNVLGIVSGLLGVGGIVGGLYVSFFKLPRNTIKAIYFSAALSFILGDLLMGLGQNISLWCIASLAASIPIPFINAGQNVIIYNHISTEMQGRIFAVRNAVQYATIPVGILLGGFLADYVFEPFMQSQNAIALFLQKIVGKSAGSGMAVMFICTGILGCLTSIMWYKNREIRKLK